MLSLSTPLLQRSAPARPGLLLRVPGRAASFPRAVGIVQRRYSLASRRSSAKLAASPDLVDDAVAHPVGLPGHHLSLRNLRVRGNSIPWLSSLSLSADRAAAQHRTHRDHGGGGYGAGKRAGGQPISAASVGSRFIWWHGTRGRLLMLA